MQERGGGRSRAGGRLVLVEAVAQTPGVVETSNRACGCLAGQPPDSPYAVVAASSLALALDSRTMKPRRGDFVQQPPRQAVVGGRASASLRERSPPTWG